MMVVVIMIWGRTYILGVESQNLNSNKYAITKIQSFTVYKK